MNELENYAIKQIQRIRKEPTDRLEQGFWIKVGLVDYYISFSITKKKKVVVKKSIEKLEG